MDALLVDLPQISRLLSGGAPDARETIERVRAKCPEEWDTSRQYRLGEALESLLTTGQFKGNPYVKCPALQLLCRTLGEPLDTVSFEDSGFRLWGEALQGLPQAEKLYGCAPPPWKAELADDPVLGCVTPEEAAAMLAKWPEPDYDDPPPEVYAAREQIEGWLRSACKAQKTLVIFWE
jgi:hypothetical protein